MDIPSGGRLTIQGGTYTSKGATSVSNFFCYACENANSGLYAPSISGMTIVGARYNDAIWNGASGVCFLIFVFFSPWKLKYYLGLNQLYQPNPKMGQR